jgi:hypothetical protein
MHWVLYGLIGLHLLQLIWGAWSQVASPLYWGGAVGLFAGIWGFWLWRWIRRLNLAHDGDQGIGYCIVLILVTIAEAIGLIAAFRGSKPTIDALLLFLVISVVGPLALAWIGWAKRRGKTEGLMFNASTCAFARTALPVVIFIPCIAAAMGFAQALPLGLPRAPKFLLATTYLTKSADMNNGRGVVGVGAAKEGMQVLVSVSPEQFPGEWPALLAIDVKFDADFHNEWRISGASHAFVGGSTELVDLLVSESNSRQRQANVQWMTHHGFLEAELARHMVGLNAEGTREDLRALAPLEVVAPEEPSGIETILLRGIPQGPVVVQLVLERRTSNESQTAIGQSLQTVMNGSAFSCSYR